jgi:hypothetical protein
MTNSNSSIRYQTLNHSCDFFCFSILLIKILVHCVEFHRNRISNQLFAKTDYIGINGIPVGRQVVMIDKSRAAIKENCKVLGIGVAVVNVSICCRRTNALHRFHHCRRYIAHRTGVRPPPLHLSACAARR